MLFNAPEFLFVFLPATLLLCWLADRYLGRRACVAVLIAASLYFYASWRVWALAVLAASVGVNMGLGQWMLRRPRQQPWLLAIGIAFNLGLLAYFKYTNFFLTNLGYGALAILMPIGLSFITFQKIAFLMDIRRGHIREIRPMEYILFASFFPQLIAGPIVHYRDVVGQFMQKLHVTADNIGAGLGVFAIGLAKKTVLADMLATYADPIFTRAASESITFYSAWLAALAYTFQLYFDFSGYCDMAMGLGLMFGITLPINFLSPYKSRSIIEFWRRWHITLSQFLRDYVYIPLGGNRTGALRRYANLWVVMLLGGFWHGAAWTFIVWGALHATYLVINHAWSDRGHRLPAWLGWFVTALALVVGWVIFRAPGLGAAAHVLQGMVGMGGFQLPPFMALPLNAILGQPYVALDPIANLTALLGTFWVAVALGIACLLPNSMQLHGLAPEPLHGWQRWRRTLVAPAATGILLWLALTKVFSATPTPFLYFQF